MTFNNLSNPPRLPPRPRDSHKGDYGRAVLIGGSRGMSGAIALAGMAALRSGAGLVRLAVPETCLETVAGLNPCYTTIPLPQDAQGCLLGNETMLQTVCAPASCVAFGPGVGPADHLTSTVSWLYTQLSCPLVIDADGINALAKLAQPLAAPAGERILTPHPGEFARLVKQTELTWEQQAELAIHWAAQAKVVLILKGHRSLITNGQQQVRNSTGNPGMATGGSGDVLTGIITALVAQGMAAFDAAVLACHVHGLAGDLAAQALGEISLTARDLIDYLPPAF